MPRALYANRSDLNERQIADQAPAELDDGQVRVRIDSFAVTANNATYGAFGRSLGYWKFFPAPDSLGCVPVWGFGDVIESRHDDVAVGERLYGFWPMAEELVIRPVKLRPDSLVDGSEHRAELPAVYNSYARCANDPLHNPDFEAERMVLYPLFATSFLLADFSADNDFFGASHVILTSASSKTASGTAFVLKRMQADGIRVIGLTSERNREYVEGLGYYDEVHTYPDIDNLPQTDSLLLEFSGNAEVIGKIHRRLGDHLKYSCRIGTAHFGGNFEDDGGPLPGPKPEVFFAPSQIQKRYKDWGPEEYAKRFGGHWVAFIGASRDWLTFEKCRGLEGADAAFQRFLDGTADANVGYVVKLGG
jgi:hypothetical protein